MSFGGGNSGGGSQVQTVSPYETCKTSFKSNYIRSWKFIWTRSKSIRLCSTNSQQTITGLAGQELMGTAAQQQLSDTLSGKYLNPFLSPLLQGAGIRYSNCN